MQPGNQINAPHQINALNDRQWSQIVSALPRPLRARAGNRSRFYRNFVDGVLWVAATNSLWSELPPQYGPWRAIYVRFLRWNLAGLWEGVEDVIGHQTPAAQGLHLRTSQHLALVSRRRRKAERLSRHAAMAMPDSAVVCD